MIEILNALVNFFKNVGTFLGVDLISIIGLALTLVVLLIAVVVSHFSVEAKTNRKVKQIGNYLLNNPFITDENIVEFNRIMKTRIPRAMRYQWQKYIVNRKDKPSAYLSEENCITKPIRNSIFTQSLKQVKYLISTLAIVVFMFTMGALYTSSNTVVQVLMNAGIVPALMIVIMLLYVSIMNSKKNIILSDLIFNFDEMQHQLDRAVTTFPAFVDYEILFTRKEIINGIPVLQEYLQQRAEYEQEQLEKARLSQVEHEKYDFSKLGIKGTLIMDSAMKECEFYLGNRKLLLSDIDALQSQKDLLVKNFDEKNRANQRKLNDIKDSQERLRQKLNTTTNKIVGNDIIKQQADEAKKQQLVEKEMDEDSAHYTQDCKKIDDQIAMKRKEIEDNRKMVENKLVSDFKEYSNKIYDELKNIADSNVIKELDQLKETNEKLERELEDREKFIIQKSAMYEEKVKENDSYKDLAILVEQLKKDNEIKNQEIIGANKEIESRILQLKSLRNEFERLKQEKYHEVYRYFDTDGIEFFYDEKGEPYFYNEDGKKSFYTDINKIEQLKSQKHNDAVASDEQTAESKVMQEPPKEIETEPAKEQTIALTSEELSALDELSTQGEPNVEEINQSAIEDKDKELEKQIDAENQLLEKQFKDLQTTITEAEKIADKKEAQAKQEKPKAKKTTTKKQLPKTQKQDINKRRKVKDYNSSEKKTKKSKGGYAFKVKKSPKVADDSGVDLSAFDKLSGGKK